MSSDTDWPRSLGPPDFSVTPDWQRGPPGAHRVHYWLCVEAPDGLLETAKRMQRLIEDDVAGKLDEAEFFSFAERLSELDHLGKV